MRDKIERYSGLVCAVLCALLWVVGLYLAQAEGSEYDASAYHVPDRSRVLPVSAQISSTATPIVNMFTNPPTQTAFGGEQSILGNHAPGSTLPQVGLSDPGDAIRDLPDMIRSTGDSVVTCEGGNPASVCSVDGLNLEYSVWAESPVTETETLTGCQDYQAEWVEDDGLSSVFNGEVSVIEGQSVYCEGQAPSGPARWDCHLGQPYNVSIMAGNEYVIPYDGVARWEAYGTENVHFVVCGDSQEDDVPDVPCGSEVHEGLPQDWSWVIPAWPDEVGYSLKVWVPGYEDAPEGSHSTGGQVYITGISGVGSGGYAVPLDVPLNVYGFEDASRYVEVLDTGNYSAGDFRWRLSCGGPVMPTPTPEPSYDACEVWVNSRHTSFSEGVASVGIWYDAALYLVGGVGSGGVTECGAVIECIGDYRVHKNNDGFAIGASFDDVVVGGSYTATYGSEWVSGSAGGYEWLHPESGSYGSGSIPSGAVLRWRGPGPWDVQFSTVWDIEAVINNSIDPDTRNAVSPRLYRQKWATASSFNGQQCRVLESSPFGPDPTPTPTPTPVPTVTEVISYPDIFYIESTCPVGQYTIFEVPFAMLNQWSGGGDEGGGGSGGGGGGFGDVDDIPGFDDWSGGWGAGGGSGGGGGSFGPAPTSTDTVAIPDYFFSPTDSVPVPDRIRVSYTLEEATQFDTTKARYYWLDAPSFVFSMEPNFNAYRLRGNWCCGETINSVCDEQLPPFLDDWLDFRDTERVCYDLNSMLGPLSWAMDELAWAGFLDSLRDDLDVVRSVRICIHARVLFFKDELAFLNQPFMAASYAFAALVALGFIAITW
jgi:hypothetical protein